MGLTSELVRTFNEQGAAHGEEVAAKLLAALIYIQEVGTSWQQSYARSLIKCVKASLDLAKLDNADEVYEQIALAMDTKSKSVRVAALMGRKGDAEEA